MIVSPIDSPTIFISSLIMQADTRSRNKTFSLASPYDYLLGYSRELMIALSKVDANELKRAALELQVARDLGRRIFSAGNGGSASIAEHLECDFGKGCHHGNTLQTKCLNSNVSVLTAIANDLSYDQVFKYQLELANAGPGEVLVLISSSGNSNNIVEAARYAVTKGVSVIGLTGFDGGVLKHTANISLHVPFHNYGIVEDAHQAIMHCLAQHHYLNQLAPS